MFFKRRDGSAESVLLLLRTVKPMRIWPLIWDAPYKKILNLRKWSSSRHVSKAMYKPSLCVVISNLLCPATVNFSAGMNPVILS